MTYPSQSQARQCRSHFTILLVEDEPFVREATSRILHNAGFQVSPVSDAQQAMQVFERRGREINLVMSDMVLPGRSGRQLAEELRRYSPDISILLTSGYGAIEAEQAPTDSHTYYLAKPYSKQSLVEAVEKILAAAPRKRAATQSG